MKQLDHLVSHFAWNCDVEEPFLSMRHHYHGAKHLPLFHTDHDTDDHALGLAILEYIQQRVESMTYKIGGKTHKTKPRLRWFQMRVNPLGHSQIEAVVTHTMPDGSEHNLDLMFTHDQPEHAEVFHHVKRLHNRQHKKVGMEPPHNLEPPHA